MKGYGVDISINDILAELNKYYMFFPKNDVTKAYDFAKKMHTGVLRKTGEEYIYHPLRVAYIIASLGFPANWVIAGLLHDVVEDVESISIRKIQTEYGIEVASIVDSVTKIDKNLPENQSLSRNECHNLTDLKIISGMDGAIIVKIADRIDNLRTINGLSLEKQVEKAKHTTEILIPLAKHLKAERLVTELEDLCFPILHPDENNDISNSFELYKKENFYGFNNTIELLKNNLNPGSIINPNSKLEVFITDFYSSPRSHCSIHRQLMSEISKTDELDSHLDKHNVAWFDLTLVLQNSETNPFDSFFEYYSKEIISYGIYILNTFETTRKDSRYILLRDSFGNLFRLFVKNEDEFLKYKIGNLSNSYNNNSRNSDYPNAKDNFKEHIKVFFRNGVETSIEKGATVLDFAFKLHTEIGLHFDYACLNGLPKHFSADQVLIEGDTIDISVNDSKETVDLSWIKYVQTSRAKEALYKYFKKYYSNPINLMEEFQKHNV